MANNRIYLRCRVCGGQLFLGKRFGEGYYFRPREEPLEAMLNDFFTAHEFCNGDPPDCFEIEYEIAPNYDMGMGETIRREWAKGLHYYCSDDEEQKITCDKLPKEG